jgi:osmotically-inducible protein OsmY
MTTRAKPQPDIVAAVEAALKSRPEIGYRRGKFRVRLDGDALLLEAQVASVAAKKLALETAAAASSDVARIIDRIRVTPTVSMSDADVRSRVRDAFLKEASFADFTIEERKNDLLTSVRDQGPKPRGRLEAEVDGGVVILNGEVPGLVDKRLAGVLAWRIPGACDVVNGIVVEPPEEDGPDQIEEAVRIVLGRNPELDASQIRVGVRARTVRLTGLLPSENQRRMAEADAWRVFGVDAVINEIDLKPK